MASITSDCKLDGLKQQKYIISQFDGPGSEISVLAGLVPSRGCGRIHFIHLASGSCWQAVCSLACRLHNSSIYFHMTFSSAYLCLLLLLGWSLCHLGTTWIVQNYLVLIPFLKNYLFIYSFLVALLCIGFSLVVASKGYSRVAVLRLLIPVASLVAKHGL